MSVSTFHNICALGKENDRLWHKLLECLSINEVVKISLEATQWCQREADLCVHPRSNGLSGQLSPYRRCLFYFDALFGILILDRKEKKGKRERKCYFYCLGSILE